MVKKGMKIRFVGGKYGGKKGWIDDDGKVGETTVSVIVNLGPKKGEHATFVYSYSVATERVTTATTYAEAVMQQCPDLDCALTKICRDFAKCNIKKDLPGFNLILQRKMADATKLLEAKGSKGLYRNIKFNHSDAMDAG